MKPCDRCGTFYTGHYYYRKFALLRPLCLFCCEQLKMRDSEIITFQSNPRLDQEYLEQEAVQEVLAE